MTRCPFEPCTNNVIEVVEQRQADDDELTKLRYPQHRVGGHEWFGMCPASLMSAVAMLPGSDEYKLLAEQAAMLARMDRERRIARIQAEGVAATAPRAEHSKTPHPNEQAHQWFRGGSGGVFGHGHDNGPQGYPVLRLVTDDSTSKGDAMASVSEVRAAGGRAAQLLAVAQINAHAVSGQLAEALALLNWIREDSADPVGTPQVAAAIEDVDKVAAACGAAIEDIAAFTGRL